MEAWKLGRLEAWERLWASILAFLCLFWTRLWALILAIVGIFLHFLASILAFLGLCLGKALGLNFGLFGPKLESLKARKLKNPVELVSLKARKLKNPVELVSIFENIFADPNPI